MKAFRSVGLAALCLVFVVACAHVQPDILAGAPPVAKGYASYPLLKEAEARGEVKSLTDPTSVPDDVVAYKDLEYANMDGHSLKLDIYTPKGIDRPAPTIVFVHGGGLTSGRKEEYAVYNIDFAKRGYVTASITYRFLDVAPFPAQVQDCKCAVRWLRANAAKYNIDPDRMAMVGGSAGGYLALMVGYANDPVFEGNGGNPEQSSRVQVVGNFYGPCDFTIAPYRDSSYMKSVMGKSYDEAPKLYEQASPICHVTKDTPPTLIVHGTIDQLVPFAQSEELAAKLKEVGVPYVFDPIVGWPHTADSFVGVNEHCQYVLDKFLKQYLK